MLRIWQHTVFWLAFGAAGPALAQDPMLARPSGCRAVATMQSHGCEVETVERCDAAEGYAWRSTGHDKEGLFYVSTFTEDFVPLEVGFPRAGHGYSFDAKTSFSTPPLQTVASGQGQEVNLGVIHLYGLQKPISETQTMARVDPPLELDGVTLQRIEITGTRIMPAPVPAIDQHFMNYFDPVSGVLFGGENLIASPDGSLSDAGRPAAIFRQGQPGFDSPYPTFDCGNLSLNFTDEKATHS